MGLLGTSAICWDGFQLLNRLHNLGIRRSEIVVSSLVELVGKIIRELRVREGVSRCYVGHPLRASVRGYGGPFLWRTSQSNQQPFSAVRLPASNVHRKSCARGCA